jgi:dihydrofolate reductase
MIVVTSDPDYRAEGSIVVNSLEEALTACPPNEVTWVIGGSKIYHQLIELCEAVHLTEVDAKTLGDAYFPAIDTDETWQLLHDDGWHMGKGDEHYTRYSVWGQLKVIFEQCGLDIFAGSIL